MLYYTDSFGADRNALGEALTRLIELGQQTLEAAIASHQLSNFEVGSTISKVLSVTQYAVFKSGRAVTLNNVKIHMMTERNGVPAFQRGPILVLHASPKFLEDAMRDSRATDIIYVPWAEGERDTFKTNNPTAIPIPFVPDPGY